MYGESRRGLTLPELLIGLAIASITLAVAMPPLHQIIERQKVVASSHDVMRLIAQARAEALVHGEIRLCDANHRCERFLQTTRLEVVRGPPASANDDDILTSLTLPSGVTVRWNRFRGQALWFHRDGRSHYQNGSFLICNRSSARRIVLNWAGRPRMETATPDALC
ncbi:MAG: GspH/FimT family pseudopilin [Alcanivoracaceae bacterium]